MALNVTRYVGFQKETVYGTAATGTYQYVDAESAEMDPKGDNIIPYKGCSGLDYLYAPGAYTVGGSFSMPVDDKAFGYMLKWALGGTVVSTGTAPTVTHSFTPSTSATMDSFTMKVGKDSTEHIFAGCAIEKMKIEAKSNSIVSASFDIVGAKDSKAVISSPTAYNMGSIFTGADVTVEVGGSAINVESMTFEANFNPDLEGSITLGSRFAKKAYRGGLDVDLSFDLAFENTVELERFWGSPTGPAATVGSFAININIGANLDIIIPRAVYVSSEQPLSGRDRVIQSIKVKAFRSLDGLSGPVSFTIVNALPTATYL